MLLSKDQSELLVQLLNDSVFNAEYDLIEWKYDYENCASDESIVSVQNELRRLEKKVQNLKQLKDVVVAQINNGH